MAINVSFNGSVIYKPGAYSHTSIDLSGGFPLGPTGLVAIFGEADAGAPGAAEVSIANNVFTADQLPQIVAKYGSGAIADVAAFLFSPASDAAIPAGAQAVYIYKTNASTRSSLALANSYGTLTSQGWGIMTNRLTYKNTLSADVAPQTVGNVVILSGAANTASGETISIATDGQAAINHTISATANRAALLTDLANAFPSLNFSFNAGNLLVVNYPTIANHQRDGRSTSFEILAGGTALNDLGLVAGFYTPATEMQADIAVVDQSKLVTQESIVGGNVTMMVGFTAPGVDATAATISVTPTTVVLTVTGGASAGTITLTKSAYSALSQLVTDINMRTGWSAALGQPLFGQLPLAALDQVSNVNALSYSGQKPARIKKDAYEVAQMFGLSTLVSISSQALVGLPDASPATALNGGTLGGTQTASITNALTAFTKVRVNSVVPLFSRDASADIADGLTDPSSNYTIAGIIQATKTHLQLMSTIKSRSERQGYMSLKDTYVNCKAQSGIMNDAREQLFIQDVKQVNAQNVLKWFQPYALACMAAGARGGSPVGTPLTNKFFNISGLRQTPQSMNTPDANIVLDFDPSIQYDDAIQSGITFLENPPSGGFRLVVDNTTYGTDGNWVLNRANVLYAADVLAFDFRTQMERIYVGVKNTINATEVSATAQSILATYLAQGITVSSDDAPNGYKQLTVRIEGNTIFINFCVKLVEGIDFVLAEIILTRKQSQA